MRLVSPTGLVVRALVAAAANLAVLVATVAIAVFWTGAALLNFVPEPSLQGRIWHATLAVAAAIAVPIYVWAVRKTIRVERRQLFADTVPIEERDAEDAPSVAPLARRLSTQFDVATPGVRMHPSSTPLAYTTYGPDAPILRTGGSTPALIVSEGLVASLPPAELEAVLAHELAHLANDDLRFLSWLLVPLVAAEAIGHDEGYPTGLFDVVALLLATVASTGVGVFSRGRELAADRGAAAATGRPEALAAALERLDESAPESPSTDLREHARSVNAVNVAPTLTPNDGRFGLRATHPSLDVRLDQLRSMARSGAASNGRDVRPGRND